MCFRNCVVVMVVDYVVAVFVQIVQISYWAL